MERIEVNLETGEVKVIPLTPEEIAEAQARYAEWMAGEEVRKADQIAQLEAQLAALKETQA
jgi:hypothetical protein